MMDWTTVAWIGACLHGFAWGATGVLAWKGTQGRPETRAMVVGIGLAMVSLTIAMGLALPPDTIPVHWITVLTESGTETMTQHLEAHGAHTGILHYGILWAFTLGEWPGLRDAVWVSLWSNAIGALFFVGVARVVLGRWLPALGLSVLYLFNPLTWNSATSELASGLLGLYFWMGVIAWDAVRNDTPLRSPMGILALVQLLVLTGLAGLTRELTSVVGLTALAVALAQGRWSTDRLHARTVELGRTAWTGLIGTSWPGRLLRLLIAVLLTLGIEVAGGWLGRIGWLVSGLNPLSPTVLALPVFLLACLPVGVVVLVLFGGFTQLRKPWHFAGLPLIFIVVFRTWFSASHLTFYELVRYMTAAVPVLWLFALMGWRPLLDSLKRTQLGAWHPAAVPLTVSALCLLPLWWVLPFGDSVMRVSTNHQQAAQLLLEASERDRSCALLTRVSAQGFGATRRAPWKWVGFADPTHRAWSFADTGTPEAVLEQWPDAPECVWLYRGMDCNLENQEDCSDLVADRPVVVEKTLTAGQYNEPNERGRNRNPATIGVYVLRSSTGGRP